MFPGDWTLSSSLGLLAASVDFLWATPGFDRIYSSFWRDLSSAAETSYKLYNVLVTKQMISNELPRLLEIKTISDEIGVSGDTTTAIDYCNQTIGQYASNLTSDNLLRIAGQLSWSEIQTSVPCVLLEKVLEQAILDNLLSISYVYFFQAFLAAKIATIILLNPQQSYDGIRNADAGRVILEDLEAIQEAMLSSIDSATVLNETQIESLGMLIQMQYAIANKTCYFARSALGCSLVGQAMDNPVNPFGSSWRYTMSFFESEENWANGYTGFIEKRLTDNVNQIAGMITVPLQGLSIVVHSPAAICVTDPEGRRVGYDSKIEKIISEIPSATFTGLGCEPEMISIPELQEGEYAFNVYGLQNGSYHINVISVFAGRTASDQWINGTITNGQAIDYNVTAGPTGILTVEESLHDVGIFDITPYRAWTYQDQQIKVNVTVANIENCSENVTISLCYNGTSENGLVGTKLISLASNENETLTFTWNTTGVPPCYGGYNITAVADISPEIDDNLTNNVLQSPSTMSVRIFGDLNGDCKVDVGDVAIVAQAFGSTPSRPRWNPDANLNGDGRVDITDIALIAKHFGQHYTYP